MRRRAPPDGGERTACLSELRCLFGEWRAAVVTSDEFRALALDLPGVVEGEHQGHPDFRVAGKIFATLGPDGDWAMLKLPADVQEAVVGSGRGAYEPFPGAWGRQGCTKVRLEAVSVSSVQAALREAFNRIES